MLDWLRIFNILLQSTDVGLGWFGARTAGGAYETGSWRRVFAPGTHDVASCMGESQRGGGYANP